MKYHFVLRKKGDNYYAKGIDINYYYQAGSEAKLLDEIPYTLQNYLKLNFDGVYDPNVFYKWEPEPGDTTMFEVKIPIDFAFGLILRHIRKITPGGKNIMMKELGVKNEHIYDSLESYYLHDLKDLSIVKRCASFPIEWLLD